MNVRYIIRTAVIPMLLVLLAAGMTGCGGDDDSQDLNQPPVTKAERRDYRIKKDREEAEKS